jgi:hypothetical protein
MIAAQRSGDRKLISGRREDLRRHAGPDQIRNNQLILRGSLASVIIARRIVLPLMVTIGQFRID